MTRNLLVEESRVVFAVSNELGNSQGRACLHDHGLDGRPNRRIVSSSKPVRTQQQESGEDSAGVPAQVSHHESAHTHTYAALESTSYICPCTCKPVAVVSVMTSPTTPT